MNNIEEAVSRHTARLQAQLDYADSLMRAKQKEMEDIFARVAAENAAADSKLVSYGLAPTGGKFDEWFRVGREIGVEVENICMSELHTVADPWAHTAQTAEDRKLDPGIQRAMARVIHAKTSKLLRNQLRGRRDLRILRRAEEEIEDLRQQLWKEMKSRTSYDNHRGSLRQYYNTIANSIIRGWIADQRAHRNRQSIVEEVLRRSGQAVHDPRKDERSGTGEELDAVLREMSDDDRTVLKAMLEHDHKPSLAAKSMKLKPTTFDSRYKKALERAREIAESRLNPS